MDALSEGSIVGRYVLTRLIGEGGMGVVWAARHSVTNKLVALKMLKPEQAAIEQIRERFVREAQAACAIRHPNIVDVHDVIELEDGRAIMVMDLLDGESLGQKLDREGLLGIEEFAKLLLPVISAVGEAHAKNIVHRDLKPDNIFLVREPDGGTTVKVLDFGIAKVLTADGAETGNLTGTGAMLGTPYYMSPEQIFGEKDIDHRADIWALGIIFYECLSGTRPTQADNIGQILKIITRHDIKPLEQLVPTLPKDLTDLVNRMLSADRDQRPQSLTEVKNILARHGDIAVRSFAEPARGSRRSLPGEPSSDRVLVRSGSDVSALAATDVGVPSVRTNPDAETLSPSIAAAKPEPTPVAPPQRKSTGLIVVGLGLLLAVGAAAIAFTRVKHDDTPTSAASAPIAPVHTQTASAKPVVSVAAPVDSASAAPAMATTTTAKPTASVRVTIKHVPSATPATSQSSTSLPGNIVDKPPF